MLQENIHKWFKSTLDRDLWDAAESASSEADYKERVYNAIAQLNNKLPPQHYPNHPKELVYGLLVDNEAPLVPKDNTQSNSGYGNIIDLEKYLGVQGSTIPTKDLLDLTPYNLYLQKGTAYSLAMAFTTKEWIQTTNESGVERAKSQAINIVPFRFPTKEQETQNKPQYGILDVTKESFVNKDLRPILTSGAPKRSDHGLIKSFSQSSNLTTPELL